MIGLQDCFINFNEPDELPHTSLFTEELVNNAVFQNIKKNNTVDYDHYHMDDILESPSTTHTTGTLMSTAMNVLYMEEYDEMHQNATDIPYNEESEMNISLDDMDHSGIEQYQQAIETRCVDDGVRAMITDEQINPTVITTVDCEKMLNALKKNTQAELLHKWSEISPLRFKSMFSSKSSCNKHFRKFELEVCIKVLNEIHGDAIPPYQNSWTKAKIIENFLNLHFESVVKKKQMRRKKSVKSLKQLCSAYLERETKENLAKLLSENTWEEAYKTWQSNASIQNGIEIEGIENNIQWFSQPAVNQDGRIRFHFTDASHILTCIRSKLCTTGIQGLDRKAWEIAAESRDTSLNITLILDCVDKQDVSLARRVFGEDVEISMPEKYSAEKTFCRLIRQWFEAEDEPGLSANKRCESRLQLRKWLLDGYVSSTFPPPTRYIKGIPIQTFEALVTHIERKVQIYPLCGGQYNTRAISSQQVENFFSTFRDLDSTGKGTPKPDSIPKMMQAVAEMGKMRIDPNRYCHYSRWNRFDMAPGNYSPRAVVEVIYFTGQHYT